MGFEMLMLVGAVWVGTTVPVTWAPFLRVAVAQQPFRRILGGLNSKRTSVDFSLPSIVDEGSRKDGVDSAGHCAFLACIMCASYCRHDLLCAFRDFDEY